MPCGTTSEFVYMTHVERREVLGLCLDEGVYPSWPVLVHPKLSTRGHPPGLPCGGSFCQAWKPLLLKALTQAVTRL